jgi:serine/threonine-protein kinase
MAVVFRARDERLGRLVAIKILSPALATDSGFRRRFIAESVAAAAVDDPHIIPVYEADEADGVLFIAMRFVQGGDLRDVLLREGRLSPAQVAEFISPVASALDAAHAAGLVHRDVKPGNILVDTRPGRPDHVYLSDFGVSKGARSSGTLTGTGQFLGTPDYSAPEQIEGGTVDGRTDQYALACVAFQLLTGALPFQRDTMMAVLMAHMRSAPPSVTSLRGDLPAEVDEVIAKAMAKAPDGRYETCGDFADALRAALGLMTYRPASQQTNPPLPVTAATAPEVTAHAETEAVAESGPPARAVTTPAESAETEAVAESGPHAPASPVTEPAATTPAEPDAPRAIPATVAVQAAEPPGQEPATGATPVWPAQDGATVPPAAKGGAGRGRLVPIAAAAVIVVAAGAIPFALLRNGHSAASGKPAAATTASSASSASPASSATRTSPAIAQNSGGTANSAGSTGTANAAKYSLAGKNLTSSYPGAFISSLAFSPAGPTIAVADPGPRAGAGTCLWRTATAGCTTLNTNAYAVAFNHQGTVLATSGELAFSGQSQATVSGSTRLWNAATGTPLRLVTNPGSKGALSVAFSPDGKTLAVGDRNGKIYLWDAASGHAVVTLTDPVSKGVNSVAFSPDGATLAAADANGFSYLWNVASRQVKNVLADPVSKGVDSVAFSPDGRSLAAGDLNGRGYLWDVGTGHRAATLDDPTATGALSVAFSPDGGTLAVGDFSGGSRLWDVTRKKLIVTIPDPDGKAVGSVAFSLDGTTLATGNAGGSAFLWHMNLH